eukprot:CAMPEP_0206233132 /NCGR_PEP_ID=MMETSP0047_2-20121206/11810_1 /ASSEMBLY_ACC=CAM_ASM_000192 /TAXON_ID=195065 /ORGANISM="Chroomonas mesostigmatica_cf, Strain CCMP1168" /LENGTH=167 /DNA_ID=CAMNT_0053656963 /DNA_START=152 /DNA_END=651 /DNA_ORIENTATION=+
MAEFLSDEQINDVQEAFRLFDKKGENQISGNDMTMVFQALNCNVSMSEMSDYMQILDPHRTGTVQYSDFLPVIAKRIQHKETIDDLIKAFQVFDKDHKGTLTPDEFRHILSHFGEIMEVAEIDEYIQEADLKSPHLRADGSKTGLVNYMGFIGVMLDLSEEEIMNMG